MSPSTTVDNHIIIVGGGFGGICTARALLRHKPASVRITLLSDKEHFEYYGMIYRLVADHDASEMVLPLRDIFAGKEIEIVVDSVKSVDPVKQSLTGASGKQYAYDTLVLSPGAEAAYFGIPGMQESSLTMKTAEEAVRIKEHLKVIFAKARSASTEEQEAALTIVIIGGGATGVELAGELATQARKYAQAAGLDPSRIRIELIEAMGRLLPLLPENMSPVVQRHLEKNGVHVRLNTAVTKKEGNNVFLKEGSITSQTVVWTAGVKAHGLLATIPGIQTDKRGRVLVDGSMQAVGLKNLYVIGDSASTAFSGMAQTAIYDGHFVAKTLLRASEGKSALPYAPSQPAFAIPVGRYWAAVKYGPITAYGFFGWILRKGADFHAFCEILPWPRALLQVMKGLLD